MPRNTWINVRRKIRKKRINRKVNKGKWCRLIELKEQFTDENKKKKKKKRIAVVLRNILQLGCFIT